MIPLWKEWETGLRGWLVDTNLIGTGELFAGSLSELAATHDGFTTGMALLSDAADGATVTVRVRVELASDDRAQGRDTQFWFDLEVRP